MAVAALLEAKLRIFGGHRLTNSIFHRMPDK
jgi:hypothetical protein